MNKKTHTWYIWLSFLGFALLWGDTARRFWFRKAIFEKKFDLWMRACGNMFKLALLYMILPPILFGILINLFFGNLFAMENSLAPEIIMSVFLLVMYFMGVYATHKQKSWREKNIPHLLN